MKLKLNEQGQVVLQDGHPVYVHDDGSEHPFDAAATVAKISQLNSEAKANRIKAEDLAAKLAPFAGIENAEDAKKALELAKNIKDGELVAAGKVQEIKDAAARTAQEQVAAATREAEAKRVALEEANAKLTGQLNSHIVGGSFANSKYIQEKLAIPHDVAQAMFSNRFKVDNGKLVPMDASGNPIYSAVRHGEIADFEEAIGMMVGQYQNKDMIMKASNQGGSGARSSGGGGDKTMSRTEFAKLDPGAQAKAMKDKVTLVDG